MTAAERKAARLAWTATGWMLLTAGVAAAVLVSVDDERAIGRKAQAEMVARTPRVADATIRKGVAAIGARLVAAAHGPRFDYSFTVADYAEVNALALPGGPVWVYRGAIDAADREAAFAGVLAHEVAHLMLRHAARQISADMVARTGLELLTALLGNIGGAQTSGAAAGAMTGLLMLGYSREDEEAADREGTRLLVRAGWDGRGLLEFLEAVRRARGRHAEAVEVFFSTHPALDDRIARLLSSAKGLPPGRVDSREYRELRARLDRLPPAHHAPRP